MSVVVVVGASRVVEVGWLTLEVGPEAGTKTGGGIVILHCGWCARRGDVIGGALIALSDTDGRSSCNI